MERRELMRNLAAASAGLAATKAHPSWAIARAAKADDVPFTVTGLASAIKNGEVTAAVVAETVIERVAAGTHLEAIISFDATQLREAAQAADLAVQRGEPLGPLHGVPIMLKDNIEAVGYTNTGGTPSLRNYRPTRNATVTQRLIDAGALIAGKANMDELAGGGSTNNPTFGKARNPYNTNHIPGGSSGGSAAAVAGRLVPAALGTDTAGSIRTPAAYCGIAGLRPTQNAIPTDGIVPLALSRDTCGPMATTVADVALLYSTLSGQLEPIVPRPLKGARLGLPSAVFQENLSPAVAQRLEDVVDILTREGVVFVREDIPDLATFVERTSLITLGGAFRWDMAQYLTARETGVTFEDLADQIANPFVRDWIEPFLKQNDDTWNDYIEVTTKFIPRLRERFRAYLDEHQLLGVLFPTAPVTAGIEINTKGDLIIEGAEIPNGIWLNIQNTGPASLWGGPGLSIPAGLSDDGLPIAMELDGLLFRDRDVLSLGQSIEAVMPPTPAPV